MGFKRLRVRFIIGFLVCFKSVVGLSPLQGRSGLAQFGLTLKVDKYFHSLTKSHPDSSLRSCSVHIKLWIFS